MLCVLGTSHVLTCLGLAESCTRIIIINGIICQGPRRHAPHSCHGDRGGHDRGTDSRHRGFTADRDTRPTLFFALLVGTIRYS